MHRTSTTLTSLVLHSLSSSLALTVIAMAGYGLDLLSATLARSGASPATVGGLHLAAEVLFGLDVLLLLLVAWKHAVKVIRSP